MCTYEPATVCSCGGRGRVMVVPYMDGRKDYRNAWPACETCLKQWLDSLEEK